MKDEFFQLKKAAKASMRGERVQAEWLYETATRLILEYGKNSERDLWRSILETAKALNDTGEYTYALELFEYLHCSATDTNCLRAEFKALEGLALSTYYLGRKVEAFELLNHGIERANSCRQNRTATRFQIMANNLENGIPTLPANIKAPTETPPGRRKKQAHYSTLVKKIRERTRFD